MSSFESESRPDVLRKLVEEFLDRYRKGERPEVREYVDRYPELAAEIGDTFPELAIRETIEMRHRSLAGDPTGAADVPGSATPLDQLGDYRIIREVGRGGMGVVYEAEQVSLGRRVAVKVLPGQMLRNPLQRLRFEREAKAAAKLHHTNIVPVFGVGEQGGTPYYVMQFIQGRGLDEVLHELNQSRKSSEFKAGGPDGGSSRIAPEKECLAATRAEEAQWLLAGRTEPVGTEDRSKDLPGPSRIRPHALGPTDRTGDVASASQPTMQAAGPSSSAGPALEPTEAVSEAGVFSDPPAGFLNPGARLSGGSSSSQSSVSLPGQSGDRRSQSAHGRKVTYWQSVAQIGLQVADALEHAHKQGVLHRDIKPSNLLLDMQGSVWVTDFGLAKADDQLDLTHSGDFLGTLRYMPPEALGGKADARGDIYSLGLTLYELLAFRPAFEEKERGRLIKQVTEEAPARLGKINREVPRDLATIVHKAIEREPGHRYATAAELAADLQRFLDDEPILARPVPPWERLGRWCLHNPAVAGLAAALIFLLMGVSAAALLAAAHFNRLAIRESRAASSERAARMQAQEAQSASLKALEMAHAQAARLAVERGLTLIDQLQADQGLLWLTHALNIDPTDVSGLHEAIRICLTRAVREQVAIPRALLRPPTTTAVPPYEDEPDRLKAIAFSPDGRLAATGNRHGSIQLWDAAWGRAIGKPFGPVGRKARLTALAFSPDGRSILVGTTTRLPGDADSSGDVQLWEVPGGRPRGRPVKVPGWVAAFTRDGRLLAAMSSGKNPTYPDTRVRVFEVMTGRPTGPVLIHDREVSPVCFSPDGRALLTGDAPADQSGRSRARLWDVVTGRMIWATAPHPGWHIYGVAFSPDGRFVATAANDHHVRLFDAKTGQAVGAPMENSDQVNAVSFSPDGRIIAAGMAPGTAGLSGRHDVRLWDRVTGMPLGPDLTHDAGILDVVFSPDGIALLTASTDGVARLWTLPDGPPQGRSTGQYGAWILDFSPDGRALVTGDSDGAVRQLDPADETCQPAGPSLDAGKAIRAIKVAPDGRTAAIGVGLPFSTNSDSPEYGEVLLWDRSTGRRIAPSLKLQTDRPDNLAFSPDGRVLLTADGNTIRSWDAATGANLGRDFEVSNRNLTAMDLSPDGKLLVLGDAAGRFQVWDLAARRPKLDPVAAHRDVVNVVAFSRDGAWFATGSRDKRARVWETATGRPRSPLLKHGGDVVAVAFNPSATILATTCDDRAVRLWDPTAGTLLGPPLTQADTPQQLAFSPDGQTLAVAVPGGDTRLFDVAPPARGSAADLTLWVEAITGRSIDDREGVAPIGLVAWESRLRDLEARGVDAASVARRPGWEARRDSEMAESARRSRDLIGELWHLNRTLAADSRDWLGYLRRAAIRRASGDRAGAEADDAQALRLGPRERVVAAWRQEPQGDLEAQRWADAVAILDRLIASHPQEPTLFIDRAEIFERLGQQDRKLADLAMAIRLGTDDADTLESLAEGLARAGRWLEADACFAHLRARHRVPIKTWEHMGLSALSTGDTAAYTSFGSTFWGRYRRHLNNLDAMNGIAWNCSLGPGVPADFDGLIAGMERVIDAVPESDGRQKHWYLNTLGAILYRAGRYETAIRRLEEGIARGGGEAIEQDEAFLAMAHHQLGHRDEARRHLDRLRGHQPDTDPEQFWDEVEVQVLSREAEALVLYDPRFPADPFAGP